MDIASFVIEFNSGDYLNTTNDSLFLFKLVVSIQKSLHSIWSLQLFKLSVVTSIAIDQVTGRVELVVG